MINTNTAIAVAKAVALMLVASSAHAQVTNLVTNGGFELTTPANQSVRLIPNSLVSGVTGWTTSSQWALDIKPSDIPNAVWTTQNGGPNLVTPSPDGGNFLFMDGDVTLHGAVSQNISGLKAGDNYQLSFYSGLAQQTQHYGPTWDWMMVSLGSQQQTAWATGNHATDMPEHGFTGWQSFNMTFQATAATETLSFLAYGGPTGAPPITLLDGVSLVDVTTPPVPEPEEWAMMLVGAGLVSYQVRRKQATLEQTKLDA